MGKKNVNNISLHVCQNFVESYMKMAVSIECGLEYFVNIMQSYTNLTIML